MADKVGAYGNKASEASFRRTWDKEEYAQKAREKDREEKERMQENEELTRKGKKPRARRKEDIPKPTELMKQREAPLELEKNKGKTMIVQNPGGRGAGQPGFFCEVCSHTCKDSVAYLDHINSRMHLRRLGQTTNIERSTVEQVRARIAFLREKTKEAASAKEFDFNKRLEEVKAREDALRTERKEKKKVAKEAKRIETMKDLGLGDENTDMTQMMGFAGFGGSRK